MYIAYSSMKYVNEAIFSAASLKKHHPKLKIMLITDLIDKVKRIKHPFDILERIDPKEVAIRCKIKFMYPKSPFDRTIFIDTDTYVSLPIDDMFAVLDKFDIAVAHDFARKRTVNHHKKDVKIPGGYGFSKLKEYAEIPYAFPEFNTGIIAYKKSDQVKGFFEAWVKTYKQFKSHTPYDQPSFRVALWNSNLRIHTLPLEYNCRAKATRQKNITYRERGIFTKDHLQPRIYHFHGIPSMNQEQIEKAAQII